MQTGETYTYNTPPSPRKEFLMPCITERMAEEINIQKVHPHHLKMYSICCIYNEANPTQSATD